MQNTIPDLHFVIAKIRPVWSRVGHILVMYRHDKDGKPFVYHSETYYGDDGRKTRAETIRRARDLQSGKRSCGLRQTYISVEYRRAAFAALPAGTYTP